MAFLRLTGNMAKVAGLLARVEAMDFPPELAHAGDKERSGRGADALRVLYRDVQTLMTMPAETYAQLSADGAAAFAAAQEEARISRSAGSGVGGSGGGGGAADDDDAGELLYVAPESGGAALSGPARAFVHDGQGRTRRLLERHGLDHMALANADSCSRCNALGGCLTMCTTCHINGIFLCGECDRAVHTHAQGHARAVLASADARADAGCFVHALAPSMFVRVSTDDASGAGGADGAGGREPHVVLPDGLVKCVLPARVELREPHVCSESPLELCFQVDAAKWDIEHPKRVLSINGITWMGRVTRVVCRGCGTNFAVQPASAAVGADVTPVTLTRTRTAIAPELHRVLMALQMGADGAMTVGRLQALLFAVCGYAPPKNTLGAYVRQEQQLRLLPRFSSVACLACDNRPVVYAADGSQAAFRFNANGFGDELTTASPVVTPDSTLAAALAAAAPLSRAAATPPECGASHWLAGVDERHHNDIKSILGAHVIGCTHGTVVQIDLLRVHESPRNPVLAIVRVIVFHRRAAPTQMPRVILIIDTGCIVMQFLLAQLRVDKTWLTAIFAELFPGEAGRRVYVNEADMPPPNWAKLPVNPTLTINFTARPEAAVGEGLPAGAFTATVNLAIGGLHAPAHACTSLNQFNAASLPRVGTEAEPAEWLTKLLAARAAAARPLGAGQFRLYWEATAAAQHLHAAVALPGRLARVYGTARARVVAALASRDAALLTYNAAAPGRRLDDCGIAPLVAARVESFAPPPAAAADAAALEARDKASQRTVNLLAARAALHGILSACGYLAPAAPGAERGAGPASAPPAGAGKRARSIVNFAAAGSGGGAAAAEVPAGAAAFAALVQASPSLLALKKFKLVDARLLVLPAEGRRLLALLDTELAALQKKHGAIGRADADSVLRDRLASARSLAGEAGLLRGKLVASIKAHGEHDGQAAQIKSGLQRTLASLAKVRAAAVSVASLRPVTAHIADLPPAGELSVVHFHDARFVPLHLQPAKPPHEASWMPLLVAQRLFEAAEIGVGIAVDDVANAARVAAAQRDERAARAAALAARVTAASVSREDLVAAAGSSLLVLADGADAAAVPYTVADVGDARDRALLAQGIVALLRRDAQRFAGVAAALANLDAGVKAVEMLVPRGAFPRDAVGRTLLSVEAPRLLSGALGADAWAQFALPGATRGRAPADAAAELAADADDDDEAEDEAGAGVDDDDAAGAAFTERAAVASALAQARDDAETETLHAGA